MPSKSSCATVQQDSHQITISLTNGFRVSLKLQAGCILGLGAVEYQGHQLRNADYSIRPLLRSLDGWTYQHFELLEAEAGANVVRVRTRVIPSLAAELQWQDFFNHEFVTLPRAEGQEPEGELIWEIGEYAEEIYGKQVPGFYYSFELRTPAEFHCCIEQGTWEIDRLAKPVTVIAQRAGSVPWESEVGPDDGFYTHESQDQGENNSVIQSREGLAPPQETVIWQMMPRAAGSQTFDFQATADGWIAIYNPAPGYIQACQRKNPGTDVIAHLERHYFPRREGVKSGKKVVLAYFPEDGLSIEQIRDDWSDVYDTVNDLWRGHFDYPEDTPTTGYSPTMWAEVLSEEPLAYRRVLDMIPRLAEYGVRRLFTGIWWKMHFTEDVSDKAICHVLEYVKSDKYGGNALLKEICDKAHQHGMEVFVWVLGAVSRLSPMHQGHPEWICLDRSGYPVAAAAHPTLYCMDYNSGWADYFAERLLAIKEECGIDGLFIDSYHNLNFQPINYADPELRTNMPGLIAWQRRMREAGLGTMIETQGIFGTSLNWLDRGHLKTEAQAGVEHTFYKNMVCIKTPWIQSGRIDESFCYRATANNAPVRLETDFNVPEDLVFPQDAWESFLARINHDYLAVGDRMIRRRTLSDDRGVEWMDKGRERVLALWSFADFAYPVPEGMQVFEVTEGQELEVRNGHTQVQRFHTYRLDPAE